MSIFRSTVSTLKAKTTPPLYLIHYKNCLIQPKIHSSCNVPFSSFLSLMAIVSLLNVHVCSFRISVLRPWYLGTHVKRPCNKERKKCKYYIQCNYSSPLIFLRDTSIQENQNLVLLSLLSLFSTLSLLLW